MRLLRIIRSTPVYLLMILAVVIYALVWAYRVNATIPLDGMTRNVAIAAIAVILWGRIRNLMIRIHPLKGESIPADKWILQLFPRLLVIAIIWIAAEAQPVEPRADFTLAAVAACAILGTRALWIWNIFLGPFVALLGGALAFLAEAYYQPTDQQLAIVGGLLALVGIEAVVDKIIYRVPGDKRIEYDEVAAARRDGEQEASRRRDWAENFEKYNSDFYEEHPELESAPELEELRIQVRLRG